MDCKRAKVYNGYKIELICSKGELNVNDVLVPVTCVCDSSVERVVNLVDDFRGEPRGAQY